MGKVARLTGILTSLQWRLVCKIEDAAVSQALVGFSLLCPLDLHFVISNGSFGH